PLMYGPGATPAGMAMMPMLLPDGRIAYVLQQPGLQQPGLQQSGLQQSGFQQHAPSPVSRHGRNSGGSSSGEKRSNDNNRNRGHGRYNP
ncbi:RNA-binding protein, partial [Trifolium medium]|nr:RNA-binding protein [Trifolium medium]